MNLNRLRESNGWVVRNIRLYGNSIVQRIAIKYLGGIQNTEKLLSMITDEDIHIRCVQFNGEENETYIAEKRGR